jgi:hypothetical protein
LKTDAVWTRETFGVFAVLKRLPTDDIGRDAITMPRTRRWWRRLA